MKCKKLLYFSSFKRSFCNTAKYAKTIFSVCGEIYLSVELFKRVQALLQRTFLLDFNPSSLPFETERCLHLSKSSFCNAKGGT